jgi:hypothetical protein
MQKPRGMNHAIFAILRNRGVLMKAVIDRFEGVYAICELEDMSMVKIDILKLSQSAKEGDIIEINGDIIDIDISGTQKRKKNIEKLAEDLWK